VSKLPLPESAKRFGGQVATDPQDPERPQGSWFALSASVETSFDVEQLMSVSGQLVIKGKARSYAERAWAQIALTLVQNLGN